MCVQFYCKPDSIITHNTLLLIRQQHLQFVQRINRVSKFILLSIKAVVRAGIHNAFKILSLLYTIYMPVCVYVCSYMHNCTNVCVHV